MVFPTTVRTSGSLAFAGHQNIKTLRNWMLPAANATERPLPSVHLDIHKDMVVEAPQGLKVNLLIEKTPRSLVKGLRKWSPEPSQPATWVLCDSDLHYKIRLVKVTHRSTRSLAIFFGHPATI